MDSTWMIDVNLDLLNLKSFKEVYIYCGGDGYLRIVSTLNSFNDGWQTEGDWGIERWEKIS